MTTLNEDTALELEALAAIYLTDYTAQLPDACHVIARPMVDETNEEAKVIARIEFHFPVTYPATTIPEIKVVSMLGLNEERCEELLGALRKVANDNIGLPSVFSIVEAAREWLALRNFASDDSSHAKMMARANERKLAQQKDEEREAAESMVATSQKKQVPKFAQETPITADTYNKWLAAYRKELASNLPPASEKKLTGREIFEGKAGVALQDLLKEEDKEVHDGQDHGEEEDFDVGVFAEEEDVSSLDSD